MPIKFNSENSDLASAWFVDSNTGELVQIGELRDFSVTLDDDLIPVTDDRVLLADEPLEFTAKIEKHSGLAFKVFIITGNSLYFRFPKKLRRKIHRYNRRERERMNRNERN